MDDVHDGVPAGCVYSVLLVFALALMWWAMFDLRDRVIELEKNAPSASSAEPE